ncbi:MAG TPA: tetratricopeptide repeat protein [Verrucomicrobiae bacterium]
MSRKSKRKASQDRASSAQSKASASLNDKQPKVSDRLPEIERQLSGANERWAVLAVCIFLAVIILAVYGQTLRYEFVNYDDNVYVYGNPAVTNGLTPKGISTAFRHGELDNWVPLTAVSHMLDCQIYGLNAGGHHLTNVLLHTASVILLFLVLRQMTGALWRSAFVAAVFAVHPLHVESVAWVAERKDVLSGFFFMLTLWAYVRYVCCPVSFPRYLTVLFLFALGLMSKPMLVTLPFVLLLLDYWPLKRFSNGGPVPWAKNLTTPAQLVLEKIPLLLLSIASCILTVLAQSQGHAIQSLDTIHFSTRIDNAVVSCVTYIYQSFYPVGLAPYYPYPISGLSIWKIIGAFVMLVAISWAGILGRRKYPYLLTGWLWYLGILVPVVGIVQVGSQALADRYTYLPQIGLCFMLVWLMADLSASWWNRRLILGSLTSILIIALVLSAHLQVSYWKNSETLWAHTLAVTSNNSFAYNNLGAALAQRGQMHGATIHYSKAWNDLALANTQNEQLDEAIVQFQKALAINPNNSQARYNLGAALAQKGQLDGAIIQLNAALAIDPDDADTHNNLGFILAQKGQTDEAIIQFQRALAIDSNDARAYKNLGDALAQKGRMDEAIIQFENALAIDPNDARSYEHLAGALTQQGHMDQAIIDYQKALAIDPDNARACYNLGELLAQKGQIDAAIIQYKRALAIDPTFAEAFNNLGNALAQSGQMDNAIQLFQKALAIQPGFVAAQNNLIHVAWILATSPNPSVRNGTRAVELALQTDRLTGDGDAMALTTLAAADAEAGKFTEAITNAQRALKLASSQNDATMISELQAQIKCYQDGSPFRDSGTIP